MPTPYDRAEAWLRDHAEESIKHVSPSARLQGNRCVVGDLDGNPGDSVYITIKGPKAGRWKDPTTGRGGTKLCTYWKAARKIAGDDYQTFFAQLESFSGQSFGYMPPGAPLDWPKCVAAWTSADAENLVKLRRFSRTFVNWLHDEAHGVGTQYCRIVFPVIAAGGAVIGLHRYIEEEGKLRFSKGCTVYPLIIDTGGQIAEVHVHESRWDCYALASASGWYLKPGVRFISTLGAGNGRFIKGLVPPGAKVYVWPQNDHIGNNGQRPNEGWRNVVAANAGCEALLVEIPPAHKDLNDWIRAELVTELELADALDSAKPYTKGGPVNVTPQPASKLFPAPEERPCYRLYEKDFQEDETSWEAGVYWHSYNEKTNDLIDQRILSCVRVVAITRTAEDREFGYLLEYVPHGKTAVRYAVIPQSLLVGHVSDLMKLLRGDLGISAPYKYRELIRDFFDSEHWKFSAKRPEDFWEATGHVGWHSPTCFVLPSEIVGTQVGVWFNGQGEVANYGKGGQYDKWQTKVAKPCQDNPYLLMALACAFAGPLLEFLGIPIVGLHYYGDSTTGKSTSQAPPASVWGPPQFALSWRTTLNGLESQAPSRSSTIFVIDESHLAEPKHLDAGIYMLSNGLSKVRMNRDSSAKKREQWKTSLLSCGERSIESHLNTGNVALKAGQEVRLVSVPIEGKYGIFDNLHGASTASGFADALRDDARRHYGHAGPKFVAWLIENRESLKLGDGLAKKIDQLVQNKKLSAQELRVARSFGILALAGEVAISASILPFEEGEIQAAAAKLFKIWQRTQPQNDQSREHAQVLQRVLDFIERHSDTRFTNICVKYRTVQNEDGAPIDLPYVDQLVARDRAGWWEDIGTRRIYMFTSSGLREAIGDLDFNRALRALDEAEAFHETGTDNEKAKRRRTPNRQNPKLYWIDPEKLTP
jgi:putative DNA primase/helicase